ncbi:MAG: glycosyltransferase family A protein, partial [Flavobacterium sp.]|uniref:glycosyltransferase family A protein n=1 Tax=Flavobacterium sp. TaxID=239 RepID=UPI0026255AA2
MEYAPIIIMVYDRLEHFKNLIDSLSSDPLSIYSNLYVISDAPYKIEHSSKINEVREYAKTVTGFKNYKLIENEKNMGANASYQFILSLVFERHDKVIFFEDDNLVSPNYLRYMNDAFLKYQDNADVVFVCGYNFPISIPEQYNYDVYF